MYPAPAATAATGDADAAGLVRACTALWTATLSLMAAFMQNPAPAHRCLLARRIANNLHVLAQQECFTAECRATFGRLSRRWNARASALAGHADRPRGGVGPWLTTLLRSR